MQYCQMAVSEEGGGGKKKKSKGSAAFATISATHKVYLSEHCFLII